MNIWKSSVDHDVEILKTYYGIEVSIEPYECDIEDLWEIRINGSFVCICKADYYDVHIAVQAIYGTMSHIRSAEALKK